MNKQEIEHALLKANAYAQLPFPEDQKWLTQSIVDEVYALWMQQNQSSEVERLRKENEELLEMLKRASATLISPKWREDYNSLLQKVEQK